MTKATKAVKDLGLADEHVKVQRRLEAALHGVGQQGNLAGVDAHRKAIDAIDEQTKREQFANDTRGMTNSAIQTLIISRLEEEQAMLRASGAMEQDIELLQDEISARKKLQAVIGTGEAQVAATMAQTEAIRDQASLWNEASNAAGSFFSDLVMNGRSAFDNLKSYVKDLLAQMLSLFAKRWILDIGASLTGNASLAAMAGQAGQGSLGGSLLSAGAGFLGTNVPGFAAAGEFGSAAIGSFMGPAAPGSAAAMGQSVYAMMTNPVTIAIAAAAAIAYYFRDTGENWRAQLGFGANANAYTTQGVFGTEWLLHVAGDDAVNRSIQAFMRVHGRGRSHHRGHAQLVPDRRDHGEPRRALPHAKRWPAFGVRLPGGTRKGRPGRSRSSTCRRSTARSSTRSTRPSPISFAATRARRRSCSRQSGTSRSSSRASGA
ncbi:MAG: hypothetical protein IPH30_17055 [Betaproteobacteria bacterium]|nr:hypothetical protein [Betaproteobacteria bacterium]